jgi:general secretion pathway protein L
LSAADALLVFLDEAFEIEGWLRLADGAVVARGPGLEGVPPLADPQTGTALRVVAVVPGEAVALHWLEVPAGLAPAQAIAAGRLAAAEVSLQPIADMHVAVGGEGEGALRPVAVVPALAMAGWLGKLQTAALDPDLMIPEPLLLRAPPEGFVRYERRGTPLYRGRSDAFSIEPELAELVLADAPVEDVPHEAFEGGLGAAITDPVINLRQGAFAKRRRWTIEWPLVRRLAALAAALLLVTLAIQIVQIFRYTFEADRLEAELSQVASVALPGSAPPTRRPARRAAERAARGRCRLWHARLRPVRRRPGRPRRDRHRDQFRSGWRVAGDRCRATRPPASPPFSSSSKPPACPSSPVPRAAPAAGRRSN